MSSNASSNRSKNQYIKKFIFDYDDTLAPNFWDYCIAQLEFVKYLKKQFKTHTPDLQAILNLEAEIDKGLVKDLGFRMERFPTSFVNTYKEIATTLGIEPTEKELKKAYNLGMIAFDEKRYKKEGLFKGAEQTLNYLKNQGDELVLLTKGDSRVQELKLKATNIERWFEKDNIHIVDTKNLEIIQDIVGLKDKTLVYHVGNSLRSDVLPGLDAGVKVIYIPLETWAFEKEHKGLPTDHTNYKNLIQLDKLTDIIKQYDRL